MILIVLVCLNALFLLVWFKTTSFIEYCNLLRLNKLFFVHNYCQYINPNLLHGDKDRYKLKYYEYLLLFHSNFLTRLMSCPICCGFWGSVFLSVIYGNIFFIPILAILTYFVYYSICCLIKLHQ